MSQVGGVLRHRPFRQFWLAQTLADVGGWLALLATALVAAGEVSGGPARGLAFSAVIAARLAPTIVLGRLVGLLVTRLDPRLTMVGCDLIRFVLLISIPVVAAVAPPWLTVTWAVCATFGTAAAAAVRAPAEQATARALAPREQLDAVNRLAAVTGAGIAPIAAAGVGGVLDRALRALVDDDLTRLPITPGTLALYLSALAFLISGAVVLGVAAPGRGTVAGGRPGDRGAAPTQPRALLDGWRFVQRPPRRDILLGLLGAFAVTGLAVGVGPFLVASLGGGDAAFHLLFGALVAGLVAGAGFGRRWVGGLSDHRWYALSVALVGVAVVALPFAPQLAVAVGFAVAVGAGVGMAYVAGTGLLGAEVGAEAGEGVRIRVLAFVRSMSWVVLLAATAVAALLAGLGGARPAQLGPIQIQASAGRALLFLGGALTVLAGVFLFRDLDDKPGVPVWRDIWGSLRGRPLPIPGGRPAHGLFLVFEGGEGAGKSTQAALLVDWLTGRGFDVVTTREPGATPLGRRLRALLLDADLTADDPPSARAEALLYAADRAHHVESLIRPALARGAVVVCDRYVDSSLAYQGAGRDLSAEEIGWLSRWATADLRPDLVILLDVDPDIGLSRAAGRGPTDRLEGESVAFHRRVRRAFLDRAAADPGRYLVLDAASSPAMLAERIRVRVAPLLRVLPDAGGARPASSPDAPDPVSDGGGTHTRDGVNVGSDASSGNDVSNGSLGDRATTDDPTGAAEHPAVVGGPRGEPPSAGDSSAGGLDAGDPASPGSSGSSAPSGSSGAAREPGAAEAPHAVGSEQRPDEGPR